MIVYLAADLLWATRIKSTADALGLPCRPIRDPTMLSARLAEGGVGGAIFDLDAEPAIELLARLREDPAGSRVRVVAFGPHVRTDLLESARAAGADLVLPRGAFDRQLQDILRSLAADSPD